VKWFNIGLAAMITAVIVLPVITLAAANKLVIYGFYFCGLLELIGIICVLFHIINLKNKS